MISTASPGTIAGTIAGTSWNNAEQWDWQAVESRLRRAGETLRRLPRQRPGGAGDSWPAYPYEFSDLVAQASLRRPGLTPRPGLPGPGEISDMDWSLGWLLWLTDERARTIVFARAVCGARWAVLGRCLERRNPAGRRAGTGLSRGHMHRLYKAALDDIARRLNEVRRNPRKKSR